jgi:hypothetical protein
MNDLEDYQRGIRVLKTLDIDGFLSGLSDKFKAYFHSLPADKQRDAIVGAMHKARYEQPEMTEAEREESRQYMEAHGMTRLGGKPFPPRK